MSRYWPPTGISMCGLNRCSSRPSWRIAAQGKVLNVVGDTGARPPGEGIRTSGAVAGRNCIRNIVTLLRYGRFPFNGQRLGGPTRDTDTPWSIRDRLDLVLKGECGFGDVLGQGIHAPVPTTMRLHFVVDIVVRRSWPWGWRPVESYHRPFPGTAYCRFGGAALDGPGPVANQPLRHGRAAQSRGI